MFRYQTGKVVAQGQDEFGENTEVVKGTLKRLRVAWQEGYTGSRTPAPDRETTQTTATIFGDRNETPLLSKGDRLRTVHNGVTYNWRIKTNPMWTLQSSSNRYAVQGEVVV